MYRISKEADNEAKIRELEASVRRCDLARWIGGSLILLGGVGVFYALGSGSLVAMLIGLIMPLVGFLLGMAGLAGDSIAREALNIERARQDPKCTNIVISENWLGRKVTYVYEP